jgi:hypothetical protein
MRATATTIPFEQGEPARRPIDGVGQARAAALGNFVLLASVSGVFRFFYHQHAVPRYFLYGEIAITASLFLLAATRRSLSLAVFPVSVLFQMLFAIYHALATLGGEIANFFREIDWGGGNNAPTVHDSPDADPPGRVGPPVLLLRWYALRNRLASQLTEWEQHRHAHLALPTYFFVGVNFFTLGDLVAETGGGVASPFTSLLLAPAVVGPVVVIKRKGILALGVGAFLSSILSVWAANAHWRIVRPANHPSAWLFAAIPLILVGASLAMRWIAVRPMGKPTWFARSRSLPARWMRKQARLVSSAAWAATEPED